ncbi:MAG: hypothetical protein ABL996_10050 [Micropepsaceae bacterium]
MNDEKRHFFRAATEYYISARFGIYNGLGHVAANQLHHAVEQYCKGVLSATMTLANLKQLGHRLPTIWAAVKSLAADPTLNRFDAAIGDLDKFERVRYPDEIIKLGAIFDIAPGRDAPVPPQFVGATAPPVYALRLGPIDDLVDEIFRIAQINRDAVVAGHTRDAAVYLTRQ